MHKIYCSIILIIHFIGGFLNPLHAQKTISSDKLTSNTISRLSKTLNDRINYLNKSVIPCPPIKYDENLPANARFESDTIWLGQVQNEYTTTDDTLSILYHEYIHFLLELEGKYSYGRDSTGQIVQWDTGETYTYALSQKEIEKELQFFETNILPSYGQLSDSQRHAHIQQLKRDLAKPRELLFIYAPSDLAREEIEAYEAQLKGENLGLYQLSATGREAIQRKLKQMKTTLKRRIVYEQKMGLKSDGTNLSDKND